MNIWDLIYRLAWIVLFILLLIGTGVLVTPKLNEYRETQAHKQELEKQIRLEEEMLKVLKLKQQRFESDPEFVRGLAHEMGLAAPDEVIFKYIPETTNRANQQP